MKTEQVKYDHLHGHFVFHGHLCWTFVGTFVGESTKAENRERALHGVKFHFRLLCVLCQKNPCPKTETNRYTKFLDPQLRYRYRLRPIPGVFFRYLTPSRFARKPQATGQQEERGQRGASQVQLAPRGHRARGVLQPYSRKSQCYVTWTPPPRNIIPNTTRDHGNSQGSSLNSDTCVLC